MPDPDRVDSRWLWRAVIGLAGFSALSALAGGAELLAFWRGNEYVPRALLDGTPFSTFVVPGLLLGLVVGGTNLVAAVLAWRRSPAAVDTTLLAGGALSVWIAAELALMRQLHWLHALYGGLGLAILGLGIVLAFRSGLARQRWLVIVSVAEALGFLAPLLIAGCTVEAGIDGWAQAGIMAAAGALEGFAFGGGQALAFGLPLRRLRFALLSALAAGLVWGMAMSVLTIAHADIALHPAVWFALGVTTASVGLAAIGTAQWIELRHHAPRAHHWIGWTALAWAVALPLSFTPGPLVDETTPAITILALWACAGLLMAYTMASLTWLGVRRLTQGSP